MEHRHYGMFSEEGDIAVERALKFTTEFFGRQLARVAKQHPEVCDTAVRERMLHILIGECNERYSFGGQFEAFE